MTYPRQSAKTQRAYLRVRGQWEAHWSQGSGRRRGTIIDVGVGGVFLSPADMRAGDLQLGSCVRISVWLSAPRRLLSLSGEVRWAGRRGGFQGVGIEFDRIMPRLAGCRADTDLFGMSPPVQELSIRVDRRCSKRLGP